MAQCAPSFASIAIVVLAVGVSAAAAAQDFELVPVSSDGNRVVHLYRDADVLLAHVRFGHGSGLESSGENAAGLRRSALLRAQRDVLVAAAVLQGMSSASVRGRIGQGMILREERLPEGAYVLVYAARYSTIQVEPCPECATTEVVEGGTRW